MLTAVCSQNFLALCASGYYDGCIWHRNIKGFMIQTGDPAGSGKGGQSIWGKPFPDEIRSTLKVNFLSYHHVLPPLPADAQLSSGSSTTAASSRWQTPGLIPTSPNFS